ncbi:MAG: CBS domain-containing protein [Betaproteobacteria bacterium]
MRVSDVMTTRVDTVPPDTPVEDARELMRTRHTHHLVVIERGTIVGVVSLQDLGGRRGTPPEGTVDAHMSRDVITVSPAATLRRAANLMRGRTVGSLLVLDRRRVVGILTVSDLLELVGRGADRGVARAKRWTLKHRVAHRKQAAPSGVW